MRSRRWAEPCTSYSYAGESYCVHRRHRTPVSSLRRQSRFRIAGVSYDKVNTTFGSHNRAFHTVPTAIAATAVPGELYLVITLPIYIFIFVSGNKPCVRVVCTVCIGRADVTGRANEGTIDVFASQDLTPIRRQRFLVLFLRKYYRSIWDSTA